MSLNAALHFYNAAAIFGTQCKNKPYFFVPGTSVLNRALDSRSHNVHGARSGRCGLFERAQRPRKQGKLFIREPWYGLDLGIFV